MKPVLPLFISTFLLLGSHALGQTTPLPCKFSGPILKTPSGAVLRYTSSEMKDRATRKVDVSGLILNADVKGTAKVDLLIGTSGEVICLKIAAIHPLIRTALERALSSWAFKREELDGRPIAYLGRLEFFLCNINCGKSGSFMTLLK
jgi:hypothetical protein